MMVSCFFSFISFSMMSRMKCLRPVISCGGSDWCLFALAPRVDDLDLFGLQCRALALRYRRLQRCCGDEQQWRQGPHRCDRRLGIRLLAYIEICLRL